MIPQAKDTREAIGDFAETVENRSLLFDKMVLAKNWGHPARFHDANRFNVLRATSDGSTVLREDREAADRQSRKGGRNADANRYKADVAGALSTTQVDHPDLARRQAENSRQLLAQLERSYGGLSRTFVGRLGGRLLINMAGGEMENAGTAPDRWFGLPYLPGSAVKGVARRAAMWDIKNETDSDERTRKLVCALQVFGFAGPDLSDRGDFVWASGGNADHVRTALRSFTDSETFRGVVSFLPAYPTSVPEIMAEVLTAHPRAEDASSGRGRVNPIFFPAVREGATFGFAILVTWPPEAIDMKAVLDEADQWLRTAVTGEGIGAKTGAG